MRVYYYKEGKKYVAKSSNEDVELTTKIVDNRTTITLKAKQNIQLIKADDTIPFHVNFKDFYFLNGYQSWTDTKEFKLAERLRNIKRSPHIISHMFAMARYGDTPFYKYSIKKSHGYDIFYSKGQYESFIYSLNYKTAYLVIELIKDKTSLHLISQVEGISLTKDEEVNIFDYYMFFNFMEGLNSFKTVYPENIPERLFGYTSWYNYYQNINEEIILKDLDALDSRFNIFQIDDGYETFVGDWLDIDQKKFPNGLKPIVDKIHENGFKAGIWLAPFIAEKNSKLFKEHQDWFKKEKNGKPLKCGGNWSGQYALDLDNKEVVDYIKKSLTYYMDLGFDFFKLDFLYAAGLPLYEGRSRCQAQYNAYKMLREILKDKLILGCGANIINSFGNFDYLRVGPDVSLIFDDVAYMRVFHRERISTKITMQNTVFRSFFNKHLFGNDPDVFLLRNENIKLSFEQRKALTKINALFGTVLMTSDNVATYNDEQKKILEEALDMFRRAKVDSWKSRKNYIDVKYHVDDEQHEFTYSVNKGVFTYER
ncbi:MAG: alpha-galactosidase [Bacilli bacterium]|nr:alpha-galactosidase [Bacilli bacterium]